MYDHVVQVSHKYLSCVCAEIYMVTYSAFLIDISNPIISVLFYGNYKFFCDSYFVNHQITLWKKDYLFGVIHDFWGLDFSRSYILQVLSLVLLLNKWKFLKT